MTLTPKEYQELENIKNKMEQGRAKSKEMQYYLDLIIKSGNEQEIHNYICNIGFDSVNEFKQHLNQKSENEDFVKGLAVVGGAVLLVWLLTKK